MKKGHQYGEQSSWLFLLETLTALDEQVAEALRLLAHYAAVSPQTAEAAAQAESLLHSLEVVRAHVAAVRVAATAAGLLPPSGKPGGPIGRVEATTG